MAADKVGCCRPGIRVSWRISDGEVYCESHREGESLYLNVGRPLCAEVIDSKLFRGFEGTWPKLSATFAFLDAIIPDSPIVVCFPHIDYTEHWHLPEH